MKDTLSYKQLFDELETLNSSAYSAFINEDFEGFLSIIDDFTSSGIMEQERFPLAREAYRMSSMPYTLNDQYIGFEDNNNFLSTVAEIMSGWSISELKKRDVYPIYAYLTEAEKQERAENKLADKRIDALREYVKLYKDLYNVPQTVSVFGVPYISDVTQHQKLYVDKIVELAETRSKFHLTFDFATSSVDNDKLARLPLSEKMDYLTTNFANIFSNKHKSVSDYFTVHTDDTKILVSNYIHGKGIDRKNWKNYKKCTFCNIPLFYLELAFYFAIPSSNEIEKFLNLHGYSIKSPMTHFRDISCKKKTYHILYKDLCRWIDSGIDYNLINAMCGMQLEIKEKKK